MPPRAITTVPARYAERGDLHAGIDEAVFSLDPLLDWADRDERDGAAPPPPADIAEMLDSAGVGTVIAD